MKSQFWALFESSFHLEKIGTVLTLSFNPTVLTQNTNIHSLI